MTLAQAFRNDDIQSLPESFLGTVTENGFSSCVPQLDDTLAIGEDDRIGGPFNDFLAEPFMGMHRHSIALSGLRALQSPCFEVFPDRW